MTPTENNDFEALLRSEIAAQLQKLGQPGDKQVETPVTPAPIEVTIGGQPYKFKDAAELSGAIERTIAQAQAEIQASKASQAPIRSEVTGDDKPDWSLEGFVQKMTTDPRDAFEMVLAHKLGVEKPFEHLKEMAAQAKEVELIKKTLAVEQFKSLHPEFPIGHAGAANLLEKVREDLNLPFDARGLEAAYFMAANQYPDFRQLVAQNAQQLHQTQQDRQANVAQPQDWNSQRQPFAQQSQNPYLMPPPSPGRLSADTPLSDPFADADKLTTKQIEEIFAKATRR